MLVACRLAALSALEGHYAGVRERAGRSGQPRGAGALVAGKFEGSQQPQSGTSGLQAAFVGTSGGSLSAPRLRPLLCPPRPATPRLARTRRTAFLRHPPARRLTERMA
jgi:hypothetical protein